MRTAPSSGAARGLTESPPHWARVMMATGGWPATWAARPSATRRRRVISCSACIPTRVQFGVGGTNTASALAERWRPLGNRQRADDLAPPRSVGVGLAAAQPSPGGVLHLLGRPDGHD